MARAHSEELTGKDLVLHCIVGWFRDVGVLVFLFHANDVGELGGLWFAP